MPGYGIFKSSNVYEIVLSLIYNGLGAMIIGIYLALVVSVLTNKLEAKTHVEQHVRSIINFMHDHGLPEESQQRVLEYYQAIWKLHKGKRVKGHFDDLPQCLRTEIAFKTCGEILRKAPTTDSCAWWPCAWRKSSLSRASLSFDVATTGTKCATSSHSAP
ncbi:hypothetical protein AMAG_13661 [Allomyces macrogynus ATCC 38327]|uniref:Uncharacterized protein n=1 Tax=Allomyces macrogynus (strain ATCC 38327) TaxID=578462 RepID=A0A0L0T3Z2_ALLM3|nr:hypothetical protein AMAG_13661 [Allomyces macrogynus ATCC 38327]|eukprot:KNE69279.1 hypothetical protein AMAG_13661 [Allomyces macrogynus ATCC 38327]